MPDEFYVGDVVLHDDVHTTHVTLMLSSRHGSFKNSFATLMTAQRPGYIPFIVSAQPKLPILPRTIYVNKNAYESDEHGAFHWGPGHLGVAAGMVDGCRSGLIKEDQLDELLCIAVVWIWPTATDMERVCTRTREATVGALEQAMTGTPTLASIEAAIREGGYSNPFYKLSE
jgi:formaldehyde-activating enzyme